MQQTRYFPVRNLPDTSGVPLRSNKMVLLRAGRPLRLDWASKTVCPNSSDSASFRPASVLPCHSAIADRFHTIKRGNLWYKVLLPVHLRQLGRHGETMSRQLQDSSPSHTLPSASAWLCPAGHKIVVRPRGYGYPLVMSK